MCRSLPATAAEKAYKPIISLADTDFPPAQTRSSNWRTGSELGPLVFLFDLLYLGGEVIRRRRYESERGDFEICCRMRHAVAIQRSPDRTGSGALCQGLRIVIGGHHLQARGCILFAHITLATTAKIW